MGGGGANALAQAGAVRGAERTPDGGQLDEVATAIAAAGGAAETAPLEHHKQGGGGARRRRHPRASRPGRHPGQQRRHRSATSWKTLTPESFARIVEVNLKAAALYCIHAVLPAIGARKDGIVINVSSSAGRFETYMTGPAYNASRRSRGRRSPIHSIRRDASTASVPASSIPGEVD